MTKAGLASLMQQSQSSSAPSSGQSNSSPSGTWVADGVGPLRVWMILRFNYRDSKNGAQPPTTLGTSNLLELIAKSLPSREIISEHQGLPRVDFR